MTAKILDGKQLATKIRQDIALKVRARREQGLVAPGLAVILVGHDPASEVYVRNKQKACEEVGFALTLQHFPATLTQEALLRLIKNYNADPLVHGILVQLPLPSQIDENEVLDQIDPDKDVDGFHPHNVGLLAQRRPNLRSCTPYGIMQLLATTGIDLKGQHAVLVGASNIVGRPMALELIHAESTVTICHKYTKDLAQHIKMADILVVATGKMDVFPSEWIKPGAIVIDVGIHRLDNGQIRGDLDAGGATRRASWITPVPGGVGPMTIASLLKNTLQATENNEKKGRR